jgi:hypothetical protein
MPITIKAEITSMRASGDFFTKDVSKTITENAKDAVEWLAKQGPGLVARNLPTTGSGFTARGIEGFAYKRTRIITGAPVASLYGKVRMKPGLSRGGSAGWPAARVPYVVNRVLESGSYAGHPRRPHYQFKKAAARLRAYSRAIRIDLTKGLG